MRSLKQLKESKLAKSLSKLMMQKGMLKSLQTKVQSGSTRSLSSMSPFRQASLDMLSNA